MEKKIVLCDTNVLIDHFKRKIEVGKSLNEIGTENIVISSVTAMELIQGALNKNDLEFLQSQISRFSLINFNKEISELSFALMNKFSLSHKLQIPDAIIGATAIYFDLPLFTFNKKDFKFLPGLKLY